MQSQVENVFASCVDAIDSGILIRKLDKDDKEFHFQNWFKGRLESIGLQFDSPGRNLYPDFRLVEFTEGFELKALAYPGRKANYDSNSQVPRGEHNGRQVYYVFGRYPKSPDGSSYPVLDLVVCHGRFLNSDATYVHKNKSFPGFGSYGDILVRDRKMYVAPTPFALAEGTAHRRTLILPVEHSISTALEEVGELSRRESDDVVAAYNFDLRTNELTTELMPNPNAGREHFFKAYRIHGDSKDPVKMRSIADVIASLQDAKQCE